MEYPNVYCLKYEMWCVKFDVWANLSGFVKKNMNKTPFKKHRIKSSFFTKVFICESGIMEFGFGLAWLTKDCSYMALDNSH